MARAGESQEKPRERSTLGVSATEHGVTIGAVTECRWPIRNVLSGIRGATIRENEQRRSRERYNAALRVTCRKYEMIRVSRHTRAAKKIRRDRLASATR